MLELHAHNSIGLYDIDIYIYMYIYIYVYTYTRVCEHSSGDA